MLLGLVGLNDEALAFRRLTVVGDAGVDGMPAGVDAEAGNLWALLGAAILSTFEFEVTAGGRVLFPLKGGIA